MTERRKGGEPAVIEELRAALEGLMICHDWLGERAKGENMARGCTQYQRAKAVLAELDAKVSA